MERGASAIQRLVQFMRINCRQDEIQVRSPRGSHAILSICGYYVCFLGEVEEFNACRIEGDAETRGWLTIRCCGGRFWPHGRFGRGHGNVADRGSSFRFFFLCYGPQW